MPVVPERLAADVAAMSVRYVRVRKFTELSGYTEKAIYRKIEDGVWMLGREYRRAPDGCICIDIEGYHTWVEGGAAPASSR
jgi:hypothetical protein